MPRALPFVIMALALCGATAVFAQQQPSGAGGFQRGTISSPVLTIDSERIFIESDFGRSVARQIEAEGSALAAENRQIEAALEAEERALTDQRAELSPEDFRELANAFDEKVQQTRRDQAAKGQAINTMSNPPAGATQLKMAKGAMTAVPVRPRTNCIVCASTDPASLRVMIEYSARPVAGISMSAAAELHSAEKGRITKSTPRNPNPIAAMRNGPTRSPRIGQDSAQTMIGAVNMIAEATASDRYCNAKKFTTVEITNIIARATRDGINGHASRSAPVPLVASRAEVIAN